MSEEDVLAHYGTPRHSGRYPWGSGEDPYQSGMAFLAMYDEMRKKGLTDAEIGKGMGMTSTEVRARRSISSNDVRKQDQETARKLRDKGMSPTAIGKQMNRPESSVRALLAPTAQARAKRIDVTKSILKDNIDKYKYVDVGKGAEAHLGISDTQLKTAIAALKDEGYQLHYIKIAQVGTGKNTSGKVLTKSDVPWKEVNQNQDKIHLMSDHIDKDTGDVVHMKPPVNVDSKRIAVKYGSEGGKDADGVIYLRPGVPDISLGHAKYAQVRIAVDGTHYLKGMAMYKHDLPEGVDILFNTNKENSGNKLDALKEQKDDPKNPFGSMTRQKTYHDANGKEHQSALNIVNEEGDWYQWSNKFSSQFLSKQTPALAKQQLKLTSDSKRAELDEIMSLTNPAVKRKLLESFADGADSSAVKLKATGLPRTASHVILPINTLKDTEIYAPKYKNGEVVALVRHPHGGKFEIPELTVNNSNKEAQHSLKGAMDAVGINAKVAERLSGADFDGDAVLVIPNNHGKVKSEKALQELKGFDPKTQYAMPKGGKGIKDAKNPGALKQQLMGDVSNLITDMTIAGANNHEIARAVKHSMVVIDAEKHNLNYKQSAIDNNINELKRKYQGGAKNGASTLISRTTSQANVPNRRAARQGEGGPINPLTGEKNWVATGETYDRNGKTITKTFRSTKGAEVKDAHELVSDHNTVIERIYADHANGLKALANKARKEMISLENIKYSDSAKAAYHKEVDSLNVKLHKAELNAPLERRAQIVAQGIIKARLDATPGLDRSDVKKISGQALTEARIRVGAAKQKIDITESEWAAIQAGAFTPSRLKKIIDNTDVDVLKNLATPRDKPAMTASHLALARSMMDSGFDVGEIAARLGVSTSTIYSALKEENNG